MGGRKKLKEAEGYRKRHKEREILLNQAEGKVSQFESVSLGSSQRGGLVMLSVEKLS